MNNIDIDIIKYIIKSNRKINKCEILEYFLQPNGKIICLYEFNKKINKFNTRSYCSINIKRYNKISRKLKINKILDIY